MYPTPNPSPQIPSGEGVAITHSELVAQGEKDSGFLEKGTLFDANAFKDKKEKIFLSLNFVMQYIV